jgi:CDP-glycerol glycerophosphotransferase
MNTFKKVKTIPIIKYFAKNIAGFIKRIYMIFCNKVYGVNDRRVVFISFRGKSYSDNPKAISEKLHKVDPDISIVWLFKDPIMKKKYIPDYITCIKANTPEALKALATSKVWVDNFNKPLYTYKSKDQIYIQTWHGDRAFKKILYDSTFASKDYRLIENEICNTIVTGSKFAEKMYKSAFKYDGKFLKVGSPRNDILINNDESRINNIKTMLNIHKDENILLFAPTLRRQASKGKGSQEIKGVDLTGIINKLNMVTKKKWICLTRAHSAVSGLKGIPKSDDIIDVTNYEDMVDLLQITDLLITDYSSSATDFILTKKPTILYQSDYNEYIKYDRTFYYDFKDIGFLIAYNQKELYDIIESIFKEDTVTRNKRIQEFYCIYESGMASTRVAEYILEQLTGRKN